MGVGLRDVTPVIGKSNRGEAFLGDSGEDILVGEVRAALTVGRPDPKDRALHAPHHDGRALDDSDGRKTRFETARAVPDEPGLGRPAEARPRHPPEEGEQLTPVADAQAESVGSAEECLELGQQIAAGKFENLVLLK